MDRSLMALFTGLVGFSSLGFVFTGSNSSAGGTEGGWRLLEPIRYENLTVFPVVAATGNDTRDLLTLEEGLSSGEVIVREQGADSMIRSRNDSRQYIPSSGPAVNQLVLINRSKRPLLLLAGELVSGGKQDRIIAKDRIVAPGSNPLPLNVFCVEHGRWSAGSQFESAKTIVHPSVRESAAINQNQSQVWDSVAVGSTARAIRSANPNAAATPPPRISSAQLASVMADSAPTQSYQKIYESRQVGASVDAIVEEVNRRFRHETSSLKGERVVGVVIAYGGEVAWSDIFASGELFDAYWNKLLRSYAVEAAARPTLREAASVDSAYEFLQRLNGREKTESEPGVYRWSETTSGSLSQIELESLHPKTLTVHRLVLRRSS